MSKKKKEPAVRVLSNATLKSYQNFNDPDDPYSRTFSMEVTGSDRLIAEIEQHIGAFITCLRRSLKESPDNGALTDRIRRAFFENNDKDD